MEGRGAEDDARRAEAKKAEKRAAHAAKLAEFLKKAETKLTDEEIEKYGDSASNLSGILGVVAGGAVEALAECSGVLRAAMMVGRNAAEMARKANAMTSQCLMLAEEVEEDLEALERLRKAVEEQPNPSHDVLNAARLLLLSMVGAARLAERWVQSGGGLVAQVRQYFSAGGQSEEMEKAKNLVRENRMRLRDAIGRETLYGVVSFPRLIVEAEGRMKSAFQSDMAALGEHMKRQVESKEKLEDLLHALGDSMGGFFGSLERFGVDVGGIQSLLKEAQEEQKKVVAKMDRHQNAVLAVLASSQRKWDLQMDLQKRQMELLKSDSEKLRARESELERSFRRSASLTSLDSDGESVASPGSHGSLRCPDRSTELDLPTVINRESLQGMSEVASGRYARVLRATYSGQPVAVKVPHTRTGGCLGTRRALLREAEVLKQLSTNPNVVQYYGVILEGDMDAIVTEWCAVQRHGPDGERVSVSTLAGLTRLAAGGKVELPWHVRLGLARQVAGGMAFLHAPRGAAPRVAHGDLKGGNVLLTDAKLRPALQDTDEGQGLVAKIANFGTAVVAMGGATAMSPGLPAPGTVPWAAPERLRAGDAHGARGPSEASDVFSFGGVLFELLALEAPWESDPGGEVSRRVQGGGRVRISRQIPKLFGTTVAAKKRTVVERCQHRFPPSPQGATLGGGVPRRLVGGRMCRSGWVLTEHWRQAELPPQRRAEVRSSQVGRALEQLMAECWAACPEDRPPFNLLEDKLAAAAAAVDEAHPPDGLIAASADADADAVLEMLAQGAPVDVRWERPPESHETLKGSTALCVASLRGHADMVRVLLGAGARTDLSLATGEAPLHLACMRGHVDVVRALVRGGADVNAGEGLHIACQEGFAEVVEVLLAAGADAGRTSSGMTPLHLTCRWRQAEALRLVLAALAARPDNVPDARSEVHKELAGAVKGGHIEIVEILLAAGETLADKETASAPADPDPRTSSPGPGHGALAPPPAGWATPPRATAATTPLGAGRALPPPPAGLATPPRATAASSLSPSQGLALPPPPAGVGSPCSPSPGLGHGTQSLTLSPPSVAGAGPVAEGEPRGAAALLAACGGGHVHDLERLLRQGAMGDPGDNGGPFLHAACAAGQWGAAHVLLRAGVPVDDEGDDGGTALHAAGAGGHAAVVEGLLGAGAWANQPRRDGELPLHAAARRGHVSAARALLDGGAAAGPARRDGATPLHLACDEGNEEMVGVLLAAGAPKAAVMQGGASPLHRASQQGRAEVVRALLRAGVDPDPRRRDGATAMWVASEAGHPGVVRALVEGGSRAVHVEHEGGGTPLHIAAEKGRAEVAREIMRAGGDPHRGALHLASRLGQAEVVEVLIAEGASADRPHGDDEETALFAACRAGQTGAARALLAGGADHGHRRSDGLQPLHVASEAGRVEVVRALLQHGAPADSPCWSGATALHLASGRGQLEVVRALLRHGASVSAAGDDGESALYAACRKARGDVAEELLRAGADAGQARCDGAVPLHAAAWAGDARAAGLLLAAGAGADAQAEDGERPLHVACREGGAEVVRSLLRAGARADEPYEGSLPHQLAAAGGHADLARELQAVTAQA